MNTKEPLKNEKKIIYAAALSVNGIDTFKVLKAKNKNEAVNMAKAIAEFTNGKLVMVCQKTESIKYETLFEAK